MRTIEILLMSLPLLLIGAWFAGLRHASYRVFLAIALLLAGLGGALYWLSEDRAFTGPYNPASLQNGRVVPGTPQ
jgi:hypothetical protein